MNFEPWEGKGACPEQQERSRRQAIRRPASLHPQGREQGQDESRSGIKPVEDAEHRCAAVGDAHHQPKQLSVEALEAMSIQLDVLSPLLLPMTNHGPE